ncbi:SpoIIE family protein phosphatase [Sediminitomix flava]|uniref:Serine phosphatase RsbU (Regulator of sigma subunit) n=1 Tax=Sediminitomix flava TaxID=379075 RepID=A0A315ZD20_SEDFL|nr:SpoIIE family protein phosphatase [Sediminitomix flava]PWJ43182.1 serine phosphatase RsbU (regulator of sigma subunit) [Sediminitomix flava]
MIKGIINFIDRVQSSSVLNNIPKELKLSMNIASTLNIVLLCFSFYLFGLFLFHGNMNKVFLVAVMIFIFSVINYLPKKGKYTLYKFLVVNTVSIVLVAQRVLSLTQAKSLGTSVDILSFSYPKFIFLGLITVSMMLFSNTKEKKLFYTSLGIQISGVLFLDTFLNIIGIGIQHQNLSTEISYLFSVNPFNAIFLVVVTLLISKNHIEKVHLSLQRTNELMMTTEEELRQNIEEISATQERLASQERDLQEIFDAIPIALVISDQTSGQIIKTNKIATEIYGTMINQNVIDFYSNPKDLERVGEIVAEKGEVNDFEFQTKGKEGQTLTSLGYMRGIRFNDETRFLGCVVDITQIKEMQADISIKNRLLQEQNDEMLTVQEELRQNIEEISTTQERITEQERDLQEIFDAIPIALVISDPSSGQIIKTNKVAIETYGNMTNQNVIDFYKNTEDLEKVEEIITQRGEVNDFEFETSTKDGLTLTSLGYLRKIRFNGSTNSLACVVDISKLKEMQAEVEETNKRLQEKNDEMLTIEEELRQNLEEISTTQERLAEQERDLQGIFDAIPIPLVISDPRSGKILKTNSIANQTFATTDTMLGQPVADFYGEIKDHQKVAEIFAQDGEVSDFEFKAVHNDGSLLSSLGYMRNIRFNGEENHLGIVVDISNIKEMQKTMEVKNKELQATNDQMLTIQEELRQNMEETNTQRDFIEKTQKLTEKRNQKISRFTQILMSLSKNKHVLAGDYTRSVEVIVTTIAKTVDMNSVSAWSLKHTDETDNNIILENTLSFKSYDFSLSDGELIEIPKGSDFMKLILRESMVLFKDSDERNELQEIILKRLIPNEIHDCVALMTYDGKEVDGILLLERNKDQGAWAEEDLSFMKSAVDVLSLAKNREKEVHRKVVMEENNQWLMRLNKSRFIKAGKWEQFLEELTRACAKRLKLHEIGIWKYQQIDGEELLVNAKYYDREHNQFLKVKDLSSSEYPDYFQAISEESIIEVENVFEDDRLSEMMDKLKEHQIQSIIDIPYLLDGQVAGLIGVSQKYEFRKWSEEEVNLLKGLASLITVAYQTTHQAINHQQLQTQNQALEDMQHQLKLNYNELEKAKQTLEEKASELDRQYAQTMKSITYAETIHRSILPSLKNRKAVFDHHFVLFKAKDIVSGDFYWMSKHEDGKKIVAVVDCTGHGVPGAFVSMVGHQILSELIYQRKIVDPAIILDELDKKLITALKQEDGSNDDGMDVNLCLFEPLDSHNYQITYSGSKSTIFYVKDDQFFELKGDRRAIGGRKRKNKEIRPFTNHQIQLQTDDMLYLGTDGYQDQNNSHREKFGSSRLKQLIQRVYKKDEEFQREYFIQELDKHRGNQPQRDDITMIGIRI